MIVTTKDDDAYIQNLGIIADQNSDDESTNKTLKDDSSTIFNDEEEGEQYDFVEKNKWIFMTIYQKSPLVKKITLFSSWTTSPAIV